MIKSEDLLLVSLLAQESSIAAIARRLNLTAPAISQRLAALEARTGLSFAGRNGRSGIVLTGDGEFAAKRASGILSDLTIFQDELNERRGIISGRVRVVAPFGFGRHRLAPALGRFWRDHPGLAVDLRLSDDLATVPTTSWDILVRVAPPPETSLVSHKLSENRRLVCAAPSYVEKWGRPEHPEELQRHQCIAIFEDGSNGADWTFQSEDGMSLSVRIDPCLATNDGEVALEWAKSGLGVVVRSEWSAADAINEGGLVDVTPKGWHAPNAPIVALTTQRYQESARITAVLGFLMSSTLTVR